MTIRYLLIVVSYLFLYSFAVAQNPNIKVDNLFKILPTLKEDTTKIVVQNLLASELWRTKAQEALEYAENALKLAEKLNYQRGIAHSHNYIGLCLRTLKNSKEGLPHFQQALAISEVLKDKLLLRLSNNNMGIAYLDQALYGKALDYFFKALAYNEQINDLRGQASQVNNIGLIYKAMKDTKSALANFQKALALNIKANNKLLMAGNYNNIGTTYKDLGKLDSCLVYFQKAYTINKEINNEASQALNLSNIGEINLEQNHIAEARSNLLLAKSLNEKANNKNNLQRNIVNLAHTYMAEKKYDIAEKYMQEAYNLNKSLNNRLLTPMIYKEFAKLYQLSDKYEKSADYWEKYNLLKDSIFSQDAAEQTAKMQTLYDTEKKEKENELLRKEQVIANTQIQRQFFMGLAGAGALLSVIAFALVLLRNNREKQKVNKLLIKQADDLQEANHEILAQRDAVEKISADIHILSEIGKQISASLDVKTIIATVYTNVNTLMAAEMFGIGIYNAKMQALEFDGFMEHGEELPFIMMKLTENRTSAHCFNTQKEIIVYHNTKENPNIKAIRGDLPESIIVIPLTYNYNKIGIITVQSRKPNAYADYHVRMLQSIAAYATSALENALSFRKIESQGHELAEKNADIIASINYAKRIQNAMLPPQETLDKYLGKDNYFVLFKPRDIVSGDFYWIREVNNKVLVIVADCTGHGVPGAFVSMVGNSTLNEITKRGLSHTHLILNKLHKEISSFFNQNTNILATESLPNTDNLKVQDGMDISIISIDKETKIVEYAGQKILCTM